MPATSSSGAIAENLSWTSSTATYIICTNPRSGSWLLSDGLTSTAVAGNPREWFNVAEEQRHRALWRMDHATNLSFAAYFAQAKAESTTSNGISGIKLHHYQLEEFLSRVRVFGNLRGLTTSQTMAKVFPRTKYLWLRRRDKARQAISFLLASTTGEWWSIDGVRRRPREAGDAHPKFDPHAIAHFEQTFLEHDLKWQTYFRDNGLDPLVLDYEDLASDYRATIVSVLRWLGIADADAVRIPDSRLRQQSNIRNDEWLAQYEIFKNRQGSVSNASPIDAAVDTAQFDRAQRRSSRIPDAWRQWVAQNKLLETRDGAIVRVLVENGYNRLSALEEVRKAASDPYVQGGARTVRRFKRAMSVLNVRDQLARLNSQARRVDRRSGLSRDEFRDQYYALNSPVVLQNLMTGWAATSKWTADYLKSVAGEGVVEIMTNRDADANFEKNSNAHRTELRFADYVNMVYSGKVTNDYCLVAGNGFFNRPVSDELLADFAAFPEYLNPLNADRRCFLWFGPAGTVTPLQYDRCNVLLAQIAGRKRYRLVPASQWQYVYNSEGTISDVDCERPDLDRHPRFRHATVIDVVVQPGEVLFLPVGWWHHTRSLDVSMTVSFADFVFPNHFIWE